MSANESQSVFYNYIILDPRKPGRYTYECLNFSLLYEPIYVGKGKKFGSYDRKNQHFWLSRWTKALLYNKIKHLLVEYTKCELKSYVVEFNTGCDSPFALDTEMLMISEMGRIDLSTGILCNHTDGGEGGNGMIPPIKGCTFNEFYGEERAKEMKQKMSEYSSGQNNPASTANMSEYLRKDKGKRSYRTRKANGQIRTGQEHNFSKTVLGEDGFKEKTDKSMKTRRENGELKKSIDKMQTAKKQSAKKYTLTSPSGEEYLIYFNLSPFCKEHNLSYDTIWRRIKVERFGIIESKKKTDIMKNTIGWSIMPLF